MNVLVDTSVWSLAFRRSTEGSSPHRQALGELIREGRARMLGAVRQELLSGIREEAQLEGLKKRLRAFPDIEVRTEDYEAASHCFNICRSRGIQGSNTDFLICAVSRRRGLAIFTTDKDFSHFAEVIELQLYG